MREIVVHYEWVTVCQSNRLIADVIRKEAGIKAAHECITDESFCSSKKKNSTQLSHELVQIQDGDVLSDSPKLIQRFSDRSPSPHHGHDGFEV